MTRIDEIAPDVFRICLYSDQEDMQFNHFLIRDDEPLLYHAGYKGMFQPLREAVRTLIPEQSLRWIGFSQFESDECGALNE